MPTPDQDQVAVEEVRTPGTTWDREDPWRHRVAGMRCRTCMFYVTKLQDASTPPPKSGNEVGRCRRHAPTISGYPAVFPDDWCGDHKVDENRI